MHRNEKLAESLGTRHGKGYVCVTTPVDLVSELMTAWPCHRTSQNLCKTPAQELLSKYTRVMGG